MTTSAQVRDWLCELPRLANLLPVALVEGPSPAGPRTSSPSPASRILANLEVLALLDQRDRWAWQTPRGAIDPDRMGLLPHLDTWARDLDADAHDQNLTLKPLPDTPRLVDIANWLLQDGLLEWAETLEQWPEFADDMHSCWRRTRNAVAHLLDDKPTEQDPVCGDCHTGRLRVVAWPAEWECDQCGRLVTIQAVTIQDAARITGHPRSTLYAWAREGRFTRILSETGTKLYDLGQIRAAIAATRLSDMINTPAGKV